MTDLRYCTECGSSHRCVPQKVVRSPWVGVKWYGEWGPYWCVYCTETQNLSWENGHVHFTPSAGTPRS